MRKLGGFVMLLVCTGLTYQGLQNVKTPHPVDDEAARIACSELRVCAGDTPAWERVETTPFVRIYHIDAGRGAVTIECRWSAVLFGDVDCRADREELDPSVPEKPKRLPHELQRGSTRR